MSHVRKQFTQLLKGPQTGINIGDLRPEERTQTRKIAVRVKTDNSQGYVGIDDIYYLEGDERKAAELFVEENREVLEQIDFSQPNSIKQSVSQDLYDWILHELGERHFRKYRSVVYERRPDGVEFVIDRHIYEETPIHRYRDRTFHVKSEAETTFEKVYDHFDTEIKKADLTDHDGIVGQVEYLLEYYCVAGPYDCEPTTINGEPAVRILE